MNINVTTIYDKNNINNLCGTKAQGLAILSQNGICVPDFYVIPANIFNEFCETNDLCSINSFYSMGKYDDNILKKIHNNCSVELDMSIFNAANWMVRSSAIPQKYINQEQFASMISGAFESFSSTNQADIADCVKRVWESVFSEKAYYQCKAFSNEAIISGMGVIIQKEIKPVISGVIHTKGNRISVNWIRGHLSSIVSGSERGNIVDVYLSAANHCILRGIESSILNILENNEKEVFHQLFNISQSIVKIMSSDQEIEWIYDGNIVWIVQTQKWLSMN